MPRKKAAVPAHHEQVLEANHKSAKYLAEGNFMAYWRENEKNEPKYTHALWQPALNKMHSAWAALMAQGWREICYCPKDGTQFLVVEAGCTAVYPCSYVGEWPSGSWWVYHAGDSWPSHPILWHPMPTPEVTP